MSESLSDDARRLQDWVPETLREIAGLVRLQAKVTVALSQVVREVCNKNNVDFDKTYRRALDVADKIDGGKQ